MLFLQGELSCVLRFKTREGAEGSGCNKERAALDPPYLLAITGVLAFLRSTDMKPPHRSLSISLLVKVGVGTMKLLERDRKYNLTSPFDKTSLFTQTAFSNLSED